MTNISDDFNKEILDVGKILALKKGHKLSVVEIRKLTKAKKVKKIKWVNEIDIDSFIIDKINEGLCSLDEEIEFQVDVYYITGDDAVSSMLRLKTDSVCASVEWDEKSIKRLHNAFHTKIRIDVAKEYVNKAKKFHDFLVEALSIQKINTDIDSKTKMIHEISEGYADTELSIVINTIKDVMKSTW